MRAVGLRGAHQIRARRVGLALRPKGRAGLFDFDAAADQGIEEGDCGRHVGLPGRDDVGPRIAFAAAPRSEEHTSELQSLMRISYAVFCLKKKKIEDER